MGQKLIHLLICFLYLLFLIHLTELTIGEIHTNFRRKIVFSNEVYKIQVDAHRKLGVQF